jgi:hypothetical protein
VVGEEEAVAAAAAAAVAVAVAVAADNTIVYPHRNTKFLVASEYSVLVTVRTTHPKVHITYFNLNSASFTYIYHIVCYRLYKQKFR